MTLESALLKQIISNSEFGTWNSLKEHYLPEGEYRKIWKIVDKHVHKYHALPTFEDLKLEIRSRELQEKVFAIETVETDVPSDLLLDYLKNQFTQNEILHRVENFVENQIAIGDARENIDLLQEIVVQVEDQVEAPQGKGASRGSRRAWQGGRADDARGRLLPHALKAAFHGHTCKQRCCTLTIG